MSTQNEVAEEEEYAMDSYRRSSATPPSSSSRHSHGHRPLKVLKALNDFMTAPLWAALASLVVACIPPLQRMLDHRLPPVKGAIALLGDASIPTTLLILGAYFYTSPDTQRQPQSEDRYRSVLPPEHTDLLQRNPSRTPLLKKVQAIFSKLLKRRMRNPPSAEVHSGETKTVVVVVLSRMIIAPLLLMPLIKIATAFRLQKVLDEYAFHLSGLSSQCALADTTPVQSCVRGVDCAAHCLPARFDARTDHAEHIRGVGSIRAIAQQDYVLDILCLDPAVDDRLRHHRLIHFKAIVHILCQYPWAALGSVDGHDSGTIPLEVVDSRTSRMSMCRCDNLAS